MSRVNDYHRWLSKRAKDNWLETCKLAEAAEERLSKVGPGGEAQTQAERLRIMADATFDTYSTIMLDDPGNYSAHKRTTHSRRARRRWLS